MTAEANQWAAPTDAARRTGLISVEEAAAYLRVSPRWVYTQVRTGRLPAMLIARSWRIRPEALEAFAESFTVCGG